MRKILLLFIGVLSLGFSEDFTWQKNTSGFYESDVKAVVSPQNSSLVFTGTSKAVYKSEDHGKHTRRILSLRAGDGAVNFIYINSQEPWDLYVATDGGVYASQDEGQNWKKIYNSSASTGTSCRSIFISGQNIYLGTLKRALYKSLDETSWHAMQGELDHEAVNQITGDEKHVFLVTSHNLYRLDKDAESLKKILNEGFGEEENAEDLPRESEELTQGSETRFIKFVRFSTVPGYLVVATSRGFYFSQDQGETWNTIDSNNIPLGELNSFIVLDDHSDQCHGEDFCFDILAGTDRGAYLYKQGTWTRVYRGMETNRINDVSHDALNTVYAATDKGLFNLTMGPTLPLNLKQNVDLSAKEKLSSEGGKAWNYDDVGRYFHNEPSINSVQSMAVRYADVHPNKIEEWKHAAKRKAILPNLSVGSNRAGTELFHWDTGPNPDNLQKGREYVDWDVSLSWNLGELIWNNDQTSIDSRSKLMVELRDDILDEVTRIYFERRRMQLEILMDHAIDPQLRLEKEMRVAELTALIDALTGGKFSQKIDENVYRGSGRL